MRLKKKVLKTIGHRLRREREREGLSMIDIALELRCNIKTVRDYEIGHKPLSFHKYIELCKYLEVNPATILVESLREYFQK